jgi:hypothetical protein
MAIIAVAPMFIALGAFAIESGSGFNLHGSRTRPIYLPRRFGEVVAFIRKIQEKQAEAQTPTQKTQNNSKSKLMATAD